MPDSVRIPRSEAAEIMESIHEAKVALDESRDSYKAAEREERRKAGWFRFLVFASPFLAAIGIVLAVVGITKSAAADDKIIEAQHAIEAANTDRALNATGSCIRDNVRQQQIRAAMLGAAAKAIQPANPTAEQQAKVDDFLARYGAELVAELPYRDCSPAGIQEYLKNPPVDPNAAGG